MSDAVRRQYSASAQPAPGDVPWRTVLKIDGAVTRLTLGGVVIFRSETPVEEVELTVEQLPPVSRYTMTWFET